MARTAITTTPEQMSGTAYLEKAGTYHLFVSDIQADETFKKRDKKIIQGLSVRMKVLHGPESGKETTQDILDGTDSHKDGGEFCNARQNAFLLAVNCLVPSQLTGQAVSYDEQFARNMQLIATFENSKDKDGNKTEYLDFKRFEIYHVDDPRVADVPKCKESLGVIPKEYRHDAAFFAPLTKAGSGSSNVKSAPKDSDLDFSDIV